MSRFYFIICALLLVACGSPKIQPKLIWKESEKEIFLERVKQQATQRRKLQATGTLQMTMRGIPIRMNLSVSVEKEMGVRLELDDPSGQNVLLLVSDRKKIALFDFYQKKYYLENALHSQLTTGIGLPGLSVDALIQILLTRIPEEETVLLTEIFQMEAAKKYVPFFIAHYVPFPAHETSPTATRYFFLKELDFKEEEDRENASVQAKIHIEFFSHTINGYARRLEIRGKNSPNLLIQWKDPILTDTKLSPRLFDIPAPPPGLMQN